MRLRQVVNKVLFSGTGVDLNPANAAHRSLLPDGTVGTSASPAASTDFHFTNLQHKCERLFLHVAGKIATVTLVEAAASDDLFWNVPLLAIGYSSPYVDQKLDYQSQFWAVKQALDTNQDRPREYGTSLLGGHWDDPASASHYGIAVSKCSSRSQPPKCTPGLAWGTSDAVGGTTSDMPEVGDFFGGHVELGNLTWGVQAGAEPSSTSPRGGTGLDSRGIAGLWLFTKFIWPSTTELDYTAAAYTVDLELRLIGLGE